MAADARGEDAGEQAPEQASQNSLRLDASRPPTAAERALISEIYQETGSKRQTVLRAYGFYNGKTFGYVSEALGEPGSQQTGLEACQHDSRPVEASGGSRLAQGGILEQGQALADDLQEIDLTTEAGRLLMAQLSQAGLLHWQNKPAEKVIQ